MKKLIVIMMLALMSAPATSKLIKAEFTSSKWHASNFIRHATVVMFIALKINEMGTDYDIYKGYDGYSKQYIDDLITASKAKELKVNL